MCVVFILGAMSPLPKDLKVILHPFAREKGVI